MGLSEVLSPRRSPGPPGNREDIYEGVEEAGEGKEAMCIGSLLSIFIRCRDRIIE